MELISPNIRIDFIGKAPWFIGFSVILVAFSLYQWFSQGDSKYGVDFRGGNQMVVAFKEAVDAEKIRGALQARGMDEAVVQSFEIGSNQYAVWVSGAGEPRAVRASVEEALKVYFSDRFEILKTDYVGPTAGADLKRRAMWAIGLSLLGILIYIGVRFEFAFGVGAVVALFHDVVVAMGVYLWAGHSLTMGTVAAALTIVGYSTNDTVVIFDRMREEILRREKVNVVEIMNYCMSIMLSRTIVTSLLTFFSVLALFLFGGGAIEDLSLFLLVGIVAGSYSTIFIASPVVLMWDRLRNPAAARS